MNGKGFYKVKRKTAFVNVSRISGCHRVIRHGKRLWCPICPCQPWCVLMLVPFICIGPISFQMFLQLLLSLPWSDLQIYINSFPSHLSFILPYLCKACAIHLIYAPCNFIKCCKVISQPPLLRINCTSLSSLSL